MEYFSILLIGFAIVGLVLRSYFSTKGEFVQTETEQLLSARARRTQEETIARNFLRYHRGLGNA